MNLSQQLRAVHAGHTRIAHHQVYGLGGHDLQGLGAAAREHDIERLAAQQATQAVEDRLFIVDQQNSGFRRKLFIHACCAFTLN